MPTYDADLQAAVDATSVAKDATSVDSDATEIDIAAHLRVELAEREIETDDQEWIDLVVAGIERDPNYMIDREPRDYVSKRNA